MIRIVSHNACWFQGYPYEDLNPGAALPEVLRRLVSIYRSHEPDAICIQEVQDARMAEQLAEAFDASAAYTSGGDYPQYGCATVAATITPVGNGHDSASPPHRAWQVNRIEVDGTIVYVANVHLASNRFHDKESASKVRLEDIRGMLDCGHAIDVICGDFNEGPREFVALHLESKGFVDAAVAMAADLPSTGVNKARSDQIWVRKELESRIAGFGAEDWNSLAFDAPGKNVLSDHLPLWLKLS